MLSLLPLAALFAACGGRADEHAATADGRSGAAGHGDIAGATSSGGAIGSGANDAGGSAPEPDDAAAGGGGMTTAEGGAPGQGGAESEPGASGQSGEAGAEPAGGGGATSESPSVAVLLGDYDLYLGPPPALAGCSVAWYEPRINLSVSQSDDGKLEVLPFADFLWQAGFAAPPTVGEGTIQIAALADWAGAPWAPALELGWDALGFSGAGSAQIPYTCAGGAGTTRAVAVTLETDRTSPKLRIDPLGYRSFGFTRFDFRFSEPVKLPSGDFGNNFSDPADGAQVVELYDSDTNAALPTAWRWSFAGPVALASFRDPASAEGVTMAARLLRPLSDRAGNALVTLDQLVDIEPATLLDTELAFDGGPPIGMYGNASYHAAAEPGAECEQGGCLALDGPVVGCYEAPRSTFAVRLATPWDQALELRYRAWASSSSVSPFTVGYASGCVGSFTVSLTLLPQPEGTFTYASEWQTMKLAACGAPESENGFTLSLGCTEDTSPPDVRVIVERIARSTTP